MPHAASFWVTTRCYFGFFMVRPSSVTIFTLAMLLFLASVQLTATAQDHVRTPFKGSLVQVAGAPLGTLLDTEPAQVRLRAWSPQLGSVPIWLFPPPSSRPQTTTTRLKEGVKAEGSESLVADRESSLTLLRGSARLTGRSALNSAPEVDWRVTRRRMVTVPVAGSIDRSVSPPRLTLTIHQRNRLPSLTRNRSLRIFRFSAPLSGARSTRRGDKIASPSNPLFSTSVRTVSTRALSSSSCAALHHLAHAPAPGSVTQRVGQARGALLREVEVATDCDFYCSQALGGSAANDRIQEFFNEINTIYPDELGLTLELVKQVRRTSHSTYPTSITDSLDLLRRFESVGSTLGDADVRHLITARSLDFNVLGLAYIEAVCPPSGFAAWGLSSHSNSLLTPIVIAHEIGHNLGASHDPNSTGIMSARLGVPPPTAFSPFSRSQIDKFVSDNAVACLDEVLPELGFSASFKGSVFRSTITVPSGFSGCTVQLYAGLTRTRQRKLLYLRDLTGSVPETSVELFDVARVRPLPSREAIRVYLYPRASCSSGGELAGPLRSVRVNATRPSRVHLRGARRWIGRLSARLEISY